MNTSINYKRFREGLVEVPRLQIGYRLVTLCYFTIWDNIMLLSDVNNIDQYIGLFLYSHIQKEANVMIYQ